MQGAEIGRMLGVSESRVSQILSLIRRTLKERIDTYDSVGRRCRRAAVEPSLATGAWHRPRPEPGTFSWTGAEDAAVRGLSPGTVSGPMIPLRKNRDFRLLWLGEAASMLGTQLSGVAFPLLVLALTGSPFRAGLVGTVGLAPMALLSLPFGVVADRIDRKWALVCANVVGALALLSLGVAIWIGELAYGYILAVAFVAGCVTTFVRIAEEGVIAQIVPRPQLGEAVSQNVARQYAAGLVGPAVGGVTFAASRALPFVVDAATYLCSLAAVLGIRGRFQEARTHSVVTPWEDVREGVRWLWRQPFLRDSLLLVAGSNVVPTSLLLIVAAKDLGASPAVVGIVLALYSAGGLAGSAAVPWMQPRIPVPVVVSGAVWVDAAVFLVLAFVGTPLLLGVVVAITASSARSGMPWSWGTGSRSRPTGSRGALRAWTGSCPSRSRPSAR